jgi:hypothetical protein
MPKPKFRGNKGYVVSPALWPALKAELKARGIEFVLVGEPILFAQYPRPVLVTDGVKPFGWVRYGTCPKCCRPRGLSTDGRVTLACNGCRAAYAAAMEIPQKS